MQMKAGKPILPLVLAISSLACATSIHVSGDSRLDVTRHHSWSWVGSPGERVFASKRDRAVLDAELVRLIEFEMSSLGFEQVREGPDFWIDFRLIVQRRSVMVWVPQAAVQLSSFHSSPSYVIERSTTEERIHERTRLYVVLQDLAGGPLWQADISRRVEGLPDDLPLSDDIASLLACLPKATAD